MNKLFLVLIFLSCATLAADAELPSFNDYRRVEHSELRLGAIDFDSHPDAMNFRTRLEEHSGDYANFAGQFILTSWGCGTMCQMTALIEVETGRVLFPPELMTSIGICFHESSSLVITNPSDEEFIASFDGEAPDWFKTSYYHWDGREAQLLLESTEAVVENCEF